MRYKSITLTPQDIERFWSRVDRSDDPNSCWEWTAGCFMGGYGCFSVRTQANRFSNYKAPRIAWYLANGVDPGPLFICHACDNPRCCNPAHLFAGTQQDNMVDMKLKGRGISGERVHKARLTWDQVREIRRRFNGTRGDSPRLAREYGVSRSAIQHIVHGRCWREPQANPAEKKSA